MEGNVIENTKEKSAILKRIGEEGKSFFGALSKADERVYLILFSMYVAIFFWLKIALVTTLPEIVEKFHYALLGVVMWGTALYLFFIIASWKNLWNKNIALILSGAALIGITFWFSRIMSTNLYGAVMDVILIVLSCGKDYRKILRCTMWVGIGMLLFAGMGVPLGFTYDLQKPENISPGHSLGINYPNTWGYLAFLILLIIWYLYFRRKPVLTVVSFWTVSAFMYLFISCRTVAILTAIFPVLAVIVDNIEKYADRKTETLDNAIESDKSRISQQDIKQSEQEESHEIISSRVVLDQTVELIDVPVENESTYNAEQVKEILRKALSSGITAEDLNDVKGYEFLRESKITTNILKKQKSPINIIHKFIIIIPFIVFAFMFIASTQYEWVHAHFYYTPLHTFAMRFVQGGLYFKTYGLPLIGNPYKANQYTYVNVNGDFEEVGILDSSFAAYMIMRGMFWLTYTLIWLCVAHWKGLKKRDYAIPFLSTIILIFAMMERPGLEMWYNFILLYPLAKVISKPGTEPVLEFGETTTNVSNKVGADLTEVVESGEDNDSEIQNEEVSSIEQQSSIKDDVEETVLREEE